MNDFLNWAGDTWLGEFMRGTFWAWPFVENLHFLGLSVMFGALLAIDLRVLGVAPNFPMRSAMKLIPLVLIAFSVNLVTGIFFFAGDPYRYAFNLSFQWKMALIVLAGVNALWFWFGEHAKLVQLADGQQAEFSAKVIAALSLAIWVGVIVLGRLIPYLE
jgi:hypothetical protein